MFNKINFILAIVAFVAMISIVAVFYLVFREDMTYKPASPIPSTVSDKKTDSFEPVISSDQEPIADKKPKKRIEEEIKNLDPAKPAEIIKGIKERPSPVLEKDEYYLAEYSNEKKERIPPLSETPARSEIRWQYRFAGSVSGTPIAIVDTLYFGCYDYQGFAIDLTTGKIKQRQKIFSQAIGSTVYYNGHYIIPQRNGSIQSFNCQTGEIAWNHRSAVHVKKGDIDISISGIRVHKQDIWISKHWGNLYTLDADTGVLKSDPGVHYESRINTLAVPLGENLVYSNVAGELVCFNLAGTQKQWKHTIEAGYLLSLHSDNKYLYYNTTEKKLICLDPITKKQVWKIDLEGYGYKAIHEANGILYVASKDIYAINKTTGDIIWRHEAETLNGFNRPLALTDHFIYGTTEEGLVAKIDIQTGQITNALNLNETVKNGTLEHQGLIIISTIAKRLYVIDAWQ